MLRTKLPPDLSHTKVVRKRSGEGVLKRPGPNTQGAHRETLVKLQWAATNEPHSRWLMTWLALGEWLQKRYPW